MPPSSTTCLVPAALLLLPRSTLHTFGRARVAGGLYDGGMFAAVAELGVPYVLMHLRGTPRDMRQPHNTAYTDVAL